MTENEAKKILYTMRLATGLDDFEKPGGVPVPLTKEELADACKLAIKALEEVQQYREIGTVEELIRGKRYINIAKHHGTIGQVIDECIAYEAIGTPEECLQYKDFLDFLSDKMNPNDFETYLRLYNALEEKGCEE